MRKGLSYSTNEQSLSEMEEVCTPRVLKNAFFRNASLRLSPPLRLCTLVPLPSFREFFRRKGAETQRQGPTVVAGLHKPRHADERRSPAWTQRDCEPRPSGGVRGLSDEAGAAAFHVCQHCTPDSAPLADCLCCFFRVCFPVKEVPRLCRQKY